MMMWQVSSPTTNSLSNPSLPLPLQERAGSAEDAMNLNEKGTEEIVVSDHLKMDNVRLQSLLFEVERARSGTIKALLHVNSLLNKVLFSSK